MQIDPLLLLFGLALAGSTSLVTLYAYDRLTGSQRAARARVTARPSRSAEQARSVLHGSRTSAIPLIELLPLSAVGRAQTEQALGRAEVPLRVAEFLGIRLVLSLALALLSGAASTVLGLGVLIALTLGLVFMAIGWMLPQVWLNRKQEKRREAIERQLAPTLTTLAKSMRAGTGLLQALQYTTDETPAPLGPELAQTLRELRLGADPEDAFTRLSERVGSKDLDIAVTGILIQRTAGGNLSEILLGISHTIRERAKLYGEIKVLTSRQKLLGNLMALLPLIVAVAFITLNPDVGRLLIDTTPGRISAAIGLAFEVIGLVLIRKFARVDV